MEHFINIVINHVINIVKNDTLSDSIPLAVMVDHFWTCPTSFQKQSLRYVGVEGCWPWLMERARGRMHGEGLDAYPPINSLNIWQKLSKGSEQVTCALAEFWVIFETDYIKSQNVFSCS